MQTQAKLFRRGQFAEDSEKQHFEPFLVQLEKVYDHFSAMPSHSTVTIVSDALFKSWCADPSQFKKVVTAVVVDISNRLRFFFFSHIYKMLKLTESLAESWNSYNYLGWVLFARASLELSAVFHYYQSKLAKLDLVRTDYSYDDLVEIESTLIKYSHGTRFDWDALIAGDIDALRSKVKPTDATHAVNVLTAIDHLSKARQAFADVRAVYDMLSDYAHPNMGSHSLFIDMDWGSSSKGESRLSLTANRIRGEFVIVGSLPQVAVCITHCSALIRDTAQWLKHWSGFNESTHWTFHA